MNVAPPELDAPIETDPYWSPADLTPSTHKTPIVRITDIVKHPNADRLEIVHIGGYQCVVAKGQFKTGDFAVYIQPDSIVPERPEFSFVWEKDGGGNPRVFAEGEEVPEKYRRVTVRRLRKEWSEGLLMPLLEMFPGARFNVFIPAVTAVAAATLSLVTEFKVTPRCNYRWSSGPVEYILEEGMDVSQLLGITHWTPPEEPESTPRDPRKQYHKWPRSLKGWMYFLVYWFTLGFYDLNGNTGGMNEKAPDYVPPVYDVEAYKNYKDTFEPGEQVIVTEKLHGSNARFTFDGKKLFAGSRKLWKSRGACIWRKVIETTPDIELWCRAHEGWTLYGEVVPTQNAFTYGATKEKPDFYAFDILTPDGWLPREAFVECLAGYEILLTPRVYFGPFDISAIQPLVDGDSLVPGAKHIREGIVVKTLEERHVRGLGRAQLKIVSNTFLEKDKSTS